MRVKMRTMGRGAQGPPAHLGSVDLVNCVRGWLRSLWSVSEEPASETGNYRTSCNCCKTGGHMRELMLLYGCRCVCESTNMCARERKNVWSVLPRCCYSTSRKILSNHNRFGMKSLMLQMASFVNWLHLATLLKSIGADKKTFCPLWKSTNLFLLTECRWFGERKNHRWTVYTLLAADKCFEVIGALRCFMSAMFVPFQRLREVPFIAFTPSTGTLARHGSLLQELSLKQST